jgi:hypothetical protein
MHSWQSLVLGQSLRSISLPSPISSLKPSREIQHFSNSKEQNFPEQCRMLITGSGDPIVLPITTEMVLQNLGNIS